MSMTMAHLCESLFSNPPTPGAVTAPGRPASFPGGSRPAATRTFFAGAFALLAIVAYGLVIAAFPAGSVPLLVIDNIGSTLAALVAAGLALLAARQHANSRVRLSWRLLG